MKNKSIRLTAGRGSTRDLPVMLSIPTLTKGGGVMTRVAPVRLGKNLLLLSLVVLFSFTNLHGLTSYQVTGHKGEGIWSDTEIVNAIYRAEGGAKAKVPYGILSVKVKDEAEARQVCFNTVHNNRKRFAKQTKYYDFIEFLSSRYAPINVKNVKMFLKKERS